MAADGQPFSGFENENILQSLVELTSGTTLLKAGRNGKSHFRRFCLTPDLTRLTWESAKRTDATVLISEISELIIGQKTPNFKKNPLPECESRSFSLLYSGRSLDIICKDKKEFETWTTGLQALMNGFSDQESLEGYMAQVANNKRRQTKSVQEDKVTVSFSSLGTISRTKVLVQESACDLYTWGHGERGMLGHKDEDSERLPRVVESLLGRDIVMLACGVYHTMALSVLGEVYAWGSGKYGRLGHGNLRDRFSPLMIGIPLRGVAITYIACHENHSAAVADDGELYTWGKAGPHLGYDLEDGVTKQMRPRRVDALSSEHVTIVSCGLGHSLACTETGKVYSFGSNKYGELGLGNGSPQTPSTPAQTDSAKTPAVKVIPLATSSPSHVESIKTAVVRVACGRLHSAAIDNDGNLWMWGWGQRGQLGQGEMKNLNIPTLVEFSAPIADIACGDAHNCVLTTTGAVFSWGDNSAGQLGIAHNYQEIAKPRQVLIPNGLSISQVACGANFSSALSSGGRVFTWGYGSSGQLANNDNKGRPTPLEVESLLDKQVRFVACGAEHMGCTVVHGWVPDEEVKDCMACKKTFTTIRRKHHCRKCGGIYCGACSTKRFPLLERGYSDKVRVCERCYSVLTKDN